MIISPNPPHTLNIATNLVFFFESILGVWLEWIFEFEINKGYDLLEKNAYLLHANIMICFHDDETIHLIQKNYD